MDLENIIASNPSGTFVMVNTNDLASCAQEVARKTVEEMRATAEPAFDNEPLDIDGVCHRFHLAKNNVKSYKWRVAVGFPTQQDSMHSRVRFIPSEVEEWLREHGRHHIVVRKQRRP